LEGATRLAQSHAGPVELALRRSRGPPAIASTPAGSRIEHHHRPLVDRRPRRGKITKPAPQPLSTTCCSAGSRWVSTRRSCLRRATSAPRQHPPGRRAPDRIEGRRSAAAGPGRRWAPKAERLARRPGGPRSALMRPGISHFFQQHPITGFERGLGGCLQDRCRWEKAAGPTSSGGPLQTELAAGFQKRAGGIFEAPAHPTDRTGLRITQQQVCLAETSLQLAGPRAIPAICAPGFPPGPPVRGKGCGPSCWVSVLCPSSTLPPARLRDQGPGPSIGVDAGMPPEATVPHWPARPSTARSDSRSGLGFRGVRWISGVN